MLAYIVDHLQQHQQFTVYDYANFSEVIFGNQMSIQVAKS